MMAWLAYSLTFGWFSVTLTDGSWMLGLRPPQEMISDMCAIDPCAVWQHLIGGVDETRSHYTACAPQTRAQCDLDGSTRRAATTCGRGGAPSPFPNPHTVRLHAAPRPAAAATNTLAAELIN
eukprot:1195899-Prorocentrum_minimum.AAC.1